jgi:hypothetical protein
MKKIKIIKLKDWMKPVNIDRVFEKYYKRMGVKNANSNNRETEGG